MTRYDKLVRDKIPEIIRENGKNPVIRVLSSEEYLLMLEEKLNEEVREYLEDKNLDELADVLEVIYAICKNRGYTPADLEEKRKEKENARGGFDQKIFLEYVEDNKL
jgi:predicted house-cleaning noncanonical NTP pyrophosphatase (MazG superfamily)